MTHFIRNTVALVSCAGLVILAGCEPAPTCSGDWCGTVVVVSGAEADVLLPPATRQDVGTAVSDLLFLKLADIGPSQRTVGNADFTPRLAESWRFTDPLTLELTLREDARWQDGTPVTASDVAFTFEVYRDTLLATIAGPRLDRITGMTATDERTVIVTFSRAYAEQFFDAVYHMRILPRHLLDSVPRDRLAAHPFGRQPIGNGPFRFVEWRAGESIELEADSMFFLGRPGPRRIIWRFVADLNTAITQLVADEADVLNFLGGPDNVQRIAETEHLEVVEYPSSVYYYVAFNFRDPDNLSRPHPLFSDQEIRRAITMATDRTTILQAVLGARGYVPPGPISPALWIWSDQTPGLPFDSAGARQMLASRGWVDADGDGTLDRQGQPFEFELLVPTSSAPRRQAAQILQEQLRRIGVAVQLTELEFNAFLNQASERQFDAVFGAYGGEISPASVGEVWGSAAVESFNWGNYTNAAVDGLIRQAMNATDVPSASRLWNAALTAIIDDAPAIWMFTPVTTAGVHTRFDNVSLRPDQWASTIWQWRVPPDRYHERDRFAR